MCRPTDNSVSCRSCTKITELLQLLLPLVNWAFSCNPALKQHLSTCNLLVNTVIWGAVGSCFVFVNCKWYFVKNLCSITIDYWICELTASALALACQHKIFRPSFGGQKIIIMDIRNDHVLHVSGQEPSTSSKYPPSWSPLPDTLLIAISAQNFHGIFLGVIKHHSWRQE